MCLEAQDDFKFHIFTEHVLLRINCGKCSNTEPRSPSVPGSRSGHRSWARPSEDGRLLGVASPTSLGPPTHTALGVAPTSLGVASTQVTGRGLLPPPPPHVPGTGLPSPALSTRLKLPENSQLKGNSGLELKSRTRLPSCEEGRTRCGNSNALSQLFHGTGYLSLSFNRNAYRAFT